MRGVQATNTTSIILHPARHNHLRLDKLRITTIRTNLLRLISRPLTLHRLLIRTTPHPATRTASTPTTHPTAAHTLPLTSPSPLTLSPAVDRGGNLSRLPPPRRTITNRKRTRAAKGTETTVITNIRVAMTVIITRKFNSSEMKTVKVIIRSMTKVITMRMKVIIRSSRVNNIIRTREEETMHSSTAGHLTAPNHCHNNIPDPITPTITPTTATTVVAHLTTSIIRTTIEDHPLTRAGSQISSITLKKRPAQTGN
uniref:Uncharacterized protein n=1 Tax=Cacopsylla melanoneura TaxID=428564 RepID=A0A8D9A7F3_9HEMI